MALLALALRAWAPGADPPSWLTSTHAALVDGPHYVAAAAARVDGADGVAIPASFRPPLYTAFATLVYRVTGTAADLRALPSALAGAALVLVVWALLRRGAGTPAARVAALLVAVDTIAVAWSRTAVVYPTVALAGALWTTRSASRSSARPSSSTTSWRAA